MKYTIISIILIVSVFAIRDKDQRILENTREQNENGYNFRYSTSDGQERQETGRIEKVGENLILRMTGSYSYISSDGNRFEVVYEADEGGYKPSINFKPSTRSVTINEGTKKHQTSTDEPVMTSITESSSGPLFNLTENIEAFNTTEPGPEIVLLIGSAAIASLAGGGLG